MSQIECLADCRHQVVALIALDRPNLCAVSRDRQCDAGADRFSVHQNGAGAANAVLAADMRSRQQALVANKIGKRKPVIHRMGYSLAVDADIDRRHVAKSFTPPSPSCRQVLHVARSFTSPSLELRARRWLGAWFDLRGRPVPLSGLHRSRNEASQTPYHIPWMPPAPTPRATMQAAPSVCPARLGQPSARDPPPQRSWIEQN